jgi:hypothetical protein
MPGAGRHIDTCQVGRLHQLDELPEARAGVHSGGGIGRGMRAELLLN